MTPMERYNRQRDLLGLSAAKAKAKAEAKSRGLHRTIPVWAMAQNDSPTDSAGAQSRAASSDTETRASMSDITPHVWQSDPMEVHQRWAHLTTNQGMTYVEAIQTLRQDPLANVPTTYLYQFLDQTERQVTAEKVAWPATPAL